MLVEDVGSCGGSPTNAIIGNITPSSSSSSSSSPSPSPNGVGVGVMVGTNKLVAKLQQSNKSSIGTNGGSPTPPLERRRCIVSTPPKLDRPRCLDSTPSMDVEARLANTPPHVLIRSISSLSQQSMRPRTPEPDGPLGGIPALRKGILMQARDRLFSRWKERFFVLTRDYLACFRKGTTKYSEMGSFIFKVNLATVESVGWEDRRGGPALSISLPREGKVLLRAKSGLDQWYRDLREATNASRTRRNALKRGSSTMHLYTSPNGQLAGIAHSLSDSTPEIVQLCDSVCQQTSPAPARNISRPSRFSLMSNIDAGSCEGDICTPPSSVTSSTKFSSSTSSTSGSGGSSSLASSPSLRGGPNWPLRAPSPPRPDMGPRSRFSLYEGPGLNSRLNSNNSISTGPKSRHSVCVEPRGFQVDLGSVFRRKSSGLTNGRIVTSQNNRHSICVEPQRDIFRCGKGGTDLLSSLNGSRTSLCMQPRNPLLDLIETSPNSKSPPLSYIKTPEKSPKNSPSMSPSGESDSTSSYSPSSVNSFLNGTTDCILKDNSSPHRPRSQSTTVTPEKALGPRSRTNLALFRHSGLFN